MSCPCLGARHESNSTLVCTDPQPLYQRNAKTPTAQEKSDEACININAFFARVTAAGIDDFTLYAIWTLREALEDPAAGDIAKQTSPKLLKAASVWFLYASDILSKATKEGKQFDGKMAKPGASLKDGAEWKGFCQDRWNTWKERLSSLNYAELPEDTKAMIDQAVYTLTSA